MEQGALYIVEMKIRIYVDVVRAIHDLCIVSLYFRKSTSISYGYRRDTLMKPTVLLRLRNVGMFFLLDTALSWKLWTTLDEAVLNTYNKTKCNSVNCDNRSRESLETLTRLSFVSNIFLENTSHIANTITYM